jgi:hypothetical protein
MTFDVTATLNKNGQTTATTGRRLAAFLLQGSEAAFIFALTALAGQFGYVVLANEHDGLVTVGEIPAQAVALARHLSGLDSAKLTEKPFTTAEPPSDADGDDDRPRGAPTAPGNGPRIADPPEEASQRPEEGPGLTAPLRAPPY